MRCRLDACMRACRTALLAAAASARPAHCNSQHRAPLYASCSASRSNTAITLVGSVVTLLLMSLGLKLMLSSSKGATRLAPCSTSTALDAVRSGGQLELVGTARNRAPVAFCLVGVIVAGKGLSMLPELFQPLPLL